MICSIAKGIYNTGEMCEIQMSQSPRLEESALMLFLVHSDFDVNMVGRYILRTRDNALQPFVTVILIFRIAIMVFAVSAWRRVNTIGTMTMAATEEPAGLAFALQ